MAGSSDPDRLPLVSMGHALIGHYMTGVVTIPLVTLAFWALDRWAMGVGLALEAHVVTAIVGVLVTETALALVERPFVLKHDHPNPGDRVMTALVLVTPWPCWTGFLWLLHGGSAWTLTAATVATVIYAVLTVLLTEPWKEGDDTAEVRRKWQETKEMTRDL